MKNVLWKGGKSLLSAAEGGKALLTAAEKGDLDQVQTILHKKPHLIGHASLHGNTALHNAAANGRLGVVKWLVQHGQADVTVLDGSGKTALQRAANNGHTQVVEFLECLHNKTSSTTGPSPNKPPSSPVPYVYTGPPKPPSSTDPPKPPSSTDPPAKPPSEASQQVCAADAAPDDDDERIALNNDLEPLGTELKRQIESETDPLQNDLQKLNHYLSSEDLDDRLIRFVVLKEQPQDGQEVEEVIGQAPLSLLKEMALADGAKGGQYGTALRIYREIQTERNANDHYNYDGSNVLDRLALAIALEHAVPIPQDNPKAAAPDEVDTHVDPIRRYLNYEMAYRAGELDPAFEVLTPWELRFVVDGNEPDQTLAWGREMLKTYRPDHFLSRQYVRTVNTNIHYGSHRVKFDRDDQQQYQNILTNGGVCGRRAFFGRFLCRAFGIPTTARPSRGHGALVHWTPTNGWIVQLGPSWGKGWTKTVYKNDLDFLATTQARTDRQAFWKVKRAQWIGTVMGERPCYGRNDEHLKKHPQALQFWYDLSLKLQQEIIDTLPANAQNRAPNHEQPKTVVERVLATPAPANAKSIGKDGATIVIPAAAYQNPRQVKDVQVMTCASKEEGGFQIYLPAFSPQGLTLMRGGTFKSDANACGSGYRLMSGGYGKYHNWGFRLAISGSDDTSCPSPTMTIDLEDNGSTVPLDLVYVKPGTFLMGGESTTDDRFRCVEVPKHQVQLSRGFYLGKYPVTQAQYQAVMGGNPSKSTKDPNCPVDNIGVEDATEFCTKLIDTIGKDFRLPTEAEWEYASRAGCSGESKWFFGNDASQLADYAWFEENSGGHTHPVGQKLPNPFGLYDMYGNVLERVSDTYAKDYYAKSPAVDPTGPLQGSKSTFEYKISVSQPGTYSLLAEVVTANEGQSVNVCVNGKQSVVVAMPFTCGRWQESAPVKLSLKTGENKLRFWRDQPPQYGIAIQKFRLEPDQHDNDNDRVEVQKADDAGMVEVYILLGQSNMLGMGHVGSKDDIHKEGTLRCAVHQKGLYPYLIDGSKKWATSSTVRNVRVMQKGANMGVHKNEFLTIKDKEKIGPEVGIGHILEQQRNGRKIMLIKSCIGNRSLGWDLLPPGSPAYDYKGQTYAGYKESPNHWPSGGPKPKPINWYAGKQYDDDTANAKTVLKDMSKYYPGATKYQIKGFFWWQGDKDRYSEAHANHYETNLRQLIQQLRADFDAPDAKFILATMGQQEKDNVKGNDKAIYDAMMAVDGSVGKYPDFGGNVGTVYTFPLSKGGASNGHYNGNAETYMNVGEAMGKAMAELVSSA